MGVTRHVQQTRLVIVTNLTIQSQLSCAATLQHLLVGNLHDIRQRLHSQTSRSTQRSSCGDGCDHIVGIFRRSPIPTYRVLGSGGRYPRYLTFFQRRTMR
jgi:hypothetical protein